MKIPFLDLKAQYESIKYEVGVAIQQVLDNTAFALGKSVSEFEKNFASAHNVKNCIGVSSGTDGNRRAAPRRSDARCPVGRRHLRNAGGLDRTSHADVRVNHESKSR